MISGVYAPSLTAFTSGGSADPGRSAEHARWLVQAGVDGLVPFGTSGEGPSLSLREKQAVLSALVAALPGTPLVPAITESSLDTALQLVEAVNDVPATAVMLLPPFYFHPLGEDGLRRYVSEILAASAHPVLLYHIPEFAPPVPVPVVAGLPVWGVKDSGGDLSYTRAVLDAGKQVMVGAEHTIVEAVQAGAAGSIPGLANVLPEHLVAGVAAARAGDRRHGGEGPRAGAEIPRRDAGRSRAAGVDVGHQAARAITARRPAGRGAGSDAGRAGRHRPPARAAAGRPDGRARIR